MFAGIMSGELKHGPLALVDNEMPMIMIVTRDPTYQVSHFLHFGLNTIFAMKPIADIIFCEGRTVDAKSTPS